MAKAFTGPIIDDLTVDKNNPGASAQAREAVAQAHEAAKSNPEMARALQAAHEAVADTAVAYHLADTAGKAASGDQTSASKIAELERAAQSGDPAAAQAMQVIAETLQALPRRGGEDRTVSAGTNRARGQLHERMLALRAEGMAAAQALLDETGARIIGYAKTRSSGPHAGQRRSVVTLSNTVFVGPFGSTDEAARFVADSERAGDVEYAAFYSVDGLMWPGPVVEVFGADIASSGTQSSPAEEIRQLARVELSRVPSTGGYRMYLVPSRSGRAVVREFRTPREAEAWYSRTRRGEFAYAALFTPGRPPMMYWERPGLGSSSTVTGEGALVWWAP
jgi:hypothetical protein